MRLAVAVFAVAFASVAGAASPHRIALVCSTCTGEKTRASYPTSLRPAFAKAGMVEGKDFVFVLIHPDDTSLERLDVPGLLAKIAAAKPAVVLPMDVRSNTIVSSLRDIPVVLGAAYADSGVLGEPGKRPGNITGFVYGVENFDAKRLQMLRELAPAAKRVGLWVQGDLPRVDARVAELRRAAATLKLEIQEFRLDDPSEQGERTLAEMKRSGMDAFLILAGCLWRRPWIAVAQAHRLPTVYPYAWTAEGGGAAAYEQAWWDYSDVVGYVRQILDGKKPSDLPVQQQASQKLVLNAEAARELGLTLPASLIIRADRVVGQ
jgi:putative ABC transport system substrate-binding protein